jgi:hypothetical protein
MVSASLSSFNLLADETTVRAVLAEASKAEQAGRPRDASDILWEAMDTRGLPGAASVASHRWQHEFLWGAASVHFRIIAAPPPTEKYANRAVGSWTRYVEWFVELDANRDHKQPHPPVINRVNTAAEYLFNSRRALAVARHEPFHAHFAEFQATVPPEYWNLKVVRGLISALSTCPAWNYPAPNIPTRLTCDVEDCIGAATELASRVDDWLTSGVANKTDQKLGHDDLGALRRRMSQCQR